MKKTIEEYKNLFSQINSKLESTDPEDIKTVATAGYKEVVESLLHEFQTETQVNGVGGMYVLSLEEGFSQGAKDGMWKSLGIAFAVQGPRQAEWSEQANELFISASGVVYDQVMLAYDNALSSYSVLEGPGNVVDIPTANVKRADAAGYPMLKMLKARMEHSDLMGYPMEKSPLAQVGASDLKRFPVLFIDKSVITLDEAQSMINESAELRSIFQELVESRKVVENNGAPKISLDEIVNTIQESTEVKKAIQEISKNMAHGTRAHTHRAKDDEGPGF